MPPHPDAALRTVWAFERAQRADSADEIVALIREYGLVREAIPSQFLTNAAVWAALLDATPLEVIVRNLATMSRVGLLVPGSDAARLVAERLADGERIRRARLHPIKLLAALKTYAAGKGVRGSGEWSPVAQVIDALDGAFYHAFAAIEPTGKRYVLALDVSGSMAAGAVGGVPGLTPRVGSAAMALVTAASEPAYTAVAFSAPAGGGYGGQWGGGTPGLTPIALSPRQRLDDVLRATEGIPMGGTDCALPMIWALKQRLAADVFVVYTDSETWQGEVHAAVALRQYREAMGIDARLIVVGMVANAFSIADQEDGGMLDVVGFDTAAPAVMADFVREGARG